MRFCGDGSGSFRHRQSACLRPLGPYRPHSRSRRRLPCGQSHGRRRGGACRKRRPHRRPHPQRRLYFRCCKISSVCKPPGRCPHRRLDSVRRRCSGLYRIVALRALRRAYGRHNPMESRSVRRTAHRNVCRRCDAPEIQPRQERRVYHKAYTGLRSAADALRSEPLCRRPRGCLRSLHSRRRRYRDGAPELRRLSKKTSRHRPTAVPPWRWTCGVRADCHFRLRSKADRALLGRMASALSAYAAARMGSVDASVLASAARAL